MKVVSLYARLLFDFSYNLNPNAMTQIWPATSLGMSDPNLGLIIKIPSRKRGILSDIAWL